jgi:uncharacterized membrane protein
VNKIRFSSIDIARGIAVTLMIVSDLPTLISMGIVRYFAGKCAAPFFIIVAGLSYELFISSRTQRGLESKEISFESFLKSIFLLVIVMIPLFFGSLLYPERFQFAFHWDVFQIIAVGYLIGIILKRNWKLEIIAIVLIFLVMYLLKTYFYNWSNFFLTGNIPPFPYLAYFIFGRLMSEIYSSKSKIHKNITIYIITGIAFLLIYVCIILILKPGFLESDRGEPLFFIFLCSVIFLILISLNYFVDKKKIKIPLIGFERIGKIAFTSYYLFFVIELAIYPYINNHFLINFNYTTLLITYIGSYMIIILILSFVERIWSRYDYAFGIEWLLRNGVNKTMQFLKGVLKINI